MRLLDPANLRFQRRVARPGISTVGSSSRQIPDQGVGHVLLEPAPIAMRDAAVRAAAQIHSRAPARALRRARRRWRFSSFFSRRRLSGSPSPRSGPPCLEPSRQDLTGKHPGRSRHAAAQARPACRVMKAGSPCGRSSRRRRARPVPGHAAPAASPLPLTSATTELIAKACGPSRRSRGSGTRNRARASPAAERPQAPPSRARRRTARSRAGSAGSAASGPSAG